MKNRYVLLLLLIILCAMKAVPLRANDYKFRTMSPEGGFYYDGVKAIEQDSEGFIWVMMDYELYRFDGYQYKKYYPYFAALNATQGWTFNNMASDGAGNLYVNTNNGIYRYSQLTDKFERVYEPVAQVKVDGRGNVWLRHQYNWRQLDLQAGTLYTPRYDGDSLTYVDSPFCVSQNDLYTFVRRTLYRYNYEKGEFEYCFTFPESGKGSVSYAYVHEGKLWAYFYEEGLYEINLATFAIEAHYGCFPAIENNSLRAFFVDKNGKIWFGTINGLYLFNPADGELSVYQHSQADPYSLPNNSIWVITGDRQQNVWVGTYSGMLSYVNVDEGDAFQTYHAQDGGLNSPLVSTFVENEDYLWIGMEGGGVDRMDKRTGKFQNVIGAGQMSSLNVKSMALNSKNDLWVSTFRGGMNLFDASGRKKLNLLHAAGDTTSLLVNSIRKTVAVGDTGMWVAYQHPYLRISYFSVPDRKFTHYTLDNKSAYLFDMFRQGDRTLWCVSHDALYRMDVRTHAVERIAPNDSVYLRLFTACLDDAGHIWIGTVGNGLVRFDINTSQFVPMRGGTLRDMYSIYSICYDDGKVWMGTDNGLCCYDIMANQLVEFDEKANTQGQVYYPLAVLKGKEGRLYFGGTNGFTIVKPEHIAYNYYRPKAIISDFFIDQSTVHPAYDEDGDERTIVLDYDQANFGFAFASDNFNIPEKNRFRYRLRGYNNRWITVTAQHRTVMYSKVPAGTYHFEIYAANNDGVWSDVPTIIKIVRRPAPWASIPAYGLYLLIVIGIGLLIYRYYAEKRRLQLLLYQENMEKEQKEQIHQSQLRFFTNISHDFRTPLSLILAVVDKLRNDGVKEYYYRILNSNAQRLLNLVNELMDFRTVENGMMKLQLRPLDINHIVQDTTDDFRDTAQQRNINFRIQCDANLPAEIWADRSIVEKIVMNLLSNAFKYTPDGGRILIETRMGNSFTSIYQNSYSVGESGENVFSIIVSDTGIGISGESINNVFERFYKVNTVNVDSHLGTGIGLALVKSLVLLHKGAITIYSEREKGTDMVVSLPIDKTVFAPEDFMQQVPEEKRAPKTLKENAEAKDTEADDDENVQSGSKKILIAEDNDDLRNLIAESLADDFVVMQARDGKEAMDLINEDTDFDLIISDIMMPRKDGVSLCYDIKNNVETSHIPFILLTAKTSLESKIEGVDSGADLYFEKPVDLTYLKLAIHNIFKNRQQVREHYARNFYADSSELSSNQQDTRFLKTLVDYINDHISEPDMSVMGIAEELHISKTRLLAKVKGLTGETVISFIANCRMRRAAKLIIEGMSLRDAMTHVGIESQSYFSNLFKKVIGEAPSTFAAKHKKGNK